jgi:hypothetical protein
MLSSISTSVSYISTHICSDYYATLLEEWITQGGLRVSKRKDKPQAEETAQMLKRVMTVAELLAKHSAEPPAEEQATTDEKTQDQQPVVE